MKVSELIAELQKLDQDSIVVMSKDGEGNSYSPLYNAYQGVKYVAENSWSGDTYPWPITESDRKNGWDEEDIPDGGVPAVVLSTTN